MWRESDIRIRKDLKDDMGEAFIKHEMIDTVERVIDECGEHDYDWKIWEHKLDINEQRHLSELGEIFEPFTQTDFAVAVYVAVHNFPEMVIEMVKDYVREQIVNKESKK